MQSFPIRNLKLLHALSSKIEIMCVKIVSHQTFPFVCLTYLVHILFLLSSHRICWTFSLSSLTPKKLAVSVLIYFLIASFFEVDLDNCGLLGNLSLWLCSILCCPPPAGGVFVLHLSGGEAGKEIVLCTGGILSGGLGEGGGGSSWCWRGWSSGWSLTVRGDGDLVEGGGWEEECCWGGDGCCWEDCCGVGVDLLKN